MTKSTPTRKRKPSSKPRKRATPRKSRELASASRVEERIQPPPASSSWARNTLGALPGDLPSVTVRDEAEAAFYFARIDERLAEAWRRDVVMHEGPITIRRTFASRFGSTHYAYVDPRLLWYLRHDPTDPLGAKWVGYLRSARDVPQNTIAVFVGRDVVAKKSPAQITEGTP